MNTLITIVVTFFAGMGAGLGTGFAGLSAAAVISPMLITFLGMDPYMAVGIALSSDVLASAVSALSLIHIYSCIQKKSASILLKKSRKPFWTHARSPFTFHDINFMS